MAAGRYQNLQALTLRQPSKEQRLFRRNKLHRIDGWRKSRAFCLALKSGPADQISQGKPSKPSINQSPDAQAYTESSH